jgi:hypothetical protein
MAILSNPMAALASLSAMRSSAVRSGPSVGERTGGPEPGSRCDSAGEVATSTFTFSLGCGEGTCESIVVSCPMICSSSPHGEVWVSNGECTSELRTRTDVVHSTEPIR